MTTRRRAAVGILLGRQWRRDRVQVPMWIAGTALLALAGHVGIAESYATLDDRQNILAAALANPVILLFRGLPSGASAGAFFAFEVLAWVALLPALMSVFLAVRHTRADEEAGRAELIAATPAGRRTSVVATAIHGALANLAVGSAVALALVAVGSQAAGSVLVGAVAAVTGLVFLGVGLVAAQLFRTSRAANSLGMWVLVAAFVVRGLGNAIGTPGDDLTRLDSSGLVWASPFGWAEQTRPYDENLWAPAALGLTVACLLAAAAITLQSSRDLGASLVPARSGRASAARTLSSPLALVWRMSWGAILGWALGGALIGILATTLSSVVDDIAGENPAVSEVLAQIARGGTLDEAVVTVFFTMLGILAACCAVQTVTRARQEEARGTAEVVRATPVGRVRWLADYVVVATIAIVLVVGAAVATALIGVALSAGGEEGGRLAATVVVSGLGQAVAASVFTVVTALVFVVAPRATVAVGWASVLVAAMLGMFGPLLGLPEWTANTSPFAVTPLLDGSALDVRGLWWLVAVVALGGGGALSLMSRRELTGAG